MKTHACSIAFLFITFFASAQNASYRDSMEAWIKKYVKEHEVVKGKDKKLMQFYSIDESLRINCRFERKNNSPWFIMDASGPVKKNYRVYGILYFSVHDIAVSLCIYQSQELMTTEKYREHLFIPFTDATSGEETYAGGRYIDINISDINNDQVIIDFNKAYNPYCAYVSGQYSCPIPPKENNLGVSIRAGEKAFLKNH